MEAALALPGLARAIGQRLLPRGVGGTASTHQELSAPSPCSSCLILLWKFSRLQGCLVEPFSKAAKARRGFIWKLGKGDQPLSTGTADGNTDLESQEERRNQCNGEHQGKFGFLGFEVWGNIE